MLAQNQSSTQITDTHPNVLTSKDLNIPATQSTTSSMQTQKDVAANTTEKESARLSGFGMLVQNQSSTQITDTHPNVLTSKDLNIPATQSTTSSTQTRKDVAAKTTENDNEEETTCNIEKDPFLVVLN